MASQSDTPFTDDEIAAVKLWWYGGSGVPPPKVIVNTGRWIRTLEARDSIIQQLQIEGTSS